MADQNPEAVRNTEAIYGRHNLPGVVNPLQATAIGSARNTNAKRSPWFGWSIVAVVWMGLALFYGVCVLLYLGFGVIMTNTLEGVFGDSPGLIFNWILLWTALIGQLLGFATALLTTLMSLRDRRRGRGLAVGGAITGSIAAGGFFVVGLIQLPLWPMLFDALSL